MSQCIYKTTLRQQQVLNQYIYLQKQWQYGKNGVGDRKDALECRD